MAMSSETEERFCLKWNNHLSNLVNVFSENLELERLVDVTISCEGQFIKAHKVILSACSEYFRDVFDAHINQWPIIIIEGISFNDLSYIIQYIYKGEVKIHADELKCVLRAAEFLKIKGLWPINQKNTDTASTDVPSSKMATTHDCTVANTPCDNVSNIPPNVDPLDSIDRCTCPNSLTYEPPKEVLCAPVSVTRNLSSHLPARKVRNKGKRLLKRKSSEELPAIAKNYSLAAEEQVMSDDSLQTIKVEPPVIRDIDEGDNLDEWEQSKCNYIKMEPPLIIDNPEVYIDEKVNYIKVEPPAARDVDERENVDEWAETKCVQPNLNDNTTAQESSSRVACSRVTTRTKDNVDHQTSPQVGVNCPNISTSGQKQKKIPRPPNAFMMFANEWRRKVADDNPGDSNKEVSVRLGQIWKNLSGEVKESYFLAARIVEKNHRIKYPDYHYSPKEARLQKSLRKRKRIIDKVSSPEGTSGTKNSNENVYLGPTIVSKLIIKNRNSSSISGRSEIRMEH